MDDILRQFYTNQIERETVHEYFNLVLNEILLDRAFKDKDVKAVAEAKAIVDAAFSKLKDKFEPRKRAKANNQSR